MLQNEEVQMTMLDKLEAVIEAKIRPAMPIYDWDSRAIARAVLQAIREPEDAEFGLVFSNPASPEARDFANDFTTMIDAILSEKA